MKFLVLNLLGCLVLITLTGCASDTASTSQNNLDANNQPVSSIPWNKPQSWETGGALGNQLSH